MAVELEINGGVAEIVLARPERRNAIDGPLGEALGKALRDAAADPLVRVVLLRGSGGAFCSGLDLDGFNADPQPEWVPRFQMIWREAHRALFDLGKPLLGALERYAINGGAALAIACDLLITGEQAFLQVGEARIGMAAPYNMAWLTLRYSEAVAARVAIPGHRLAGRRLIELGLADECVPDADVLARARELATELAAYPEAGLPAIKRALRAGVAVDADTWFDRFVGSAPAAIRPRLQT